MFDQLPHQQVSVSELKSLANSKNFNANQVYVCQVSPQDYIIPKPSDINDYYNNPSSYTSNFHKEILPYTSMLINGIQWSKNFPRLTTTKQTRDLSISKNIRLFTIAEISCDLNGPIEFMDHASTIDVPFYYYDPIKNIYSNNSDADGIQIMSIDNLPAEIPKDSSEYFSDCLFPIINDLSKNGISGDVLSNAVICRDGVLEERFKHLKADIEACCVTRNVLVLGSGFVAAPLVDYLLRDGKTEITIASNSIQEVSRLSRNRENVETVLLDISNLDQLGKLISECDIVVSLVPASMHVTIAQECIKWKKNMVTASYISTAMKSLDERFFYLTSRAKDAGITILNEIGLDPGIDHLTAMKFFDNIPKNSTISSFVSWCGGLPAPECSDNPLGYKFSWSPRGVLLAGLNTAIYKKNNQIVKIPGTHLLKSSVDVPIYTGMSLQGLANRDSLSYIELYKLNDNIETMFRGTLRYKGYCELMAAFHDLGLFSTQQDESLSKGISWPILIMSLLNVKSESECLGAIKQKLEFIAKSTRQPDIEWDITNDFSNRVFEAMKWLGLFNHDNNVCISNGASCTVLDAFCSLLQTRLVYEKGERDMVCMHHEFKLKFDDGKKETHTSTLVVYGDPNGYSAMAKTVGLPAAIAVEMILDGKIKQVGVIAPMDKEIYEPILEKLEKEGIVFVEKKI